MARAVSLRHLRGLLQQRNDRTAGDEVFGSDNYVLGRVATIGAAMGQLTPHRMGAERKALTLNKSRDSMPVVCS